MMQMISQIQSPIFLFIFNTTFTSLLFQYIKMHISIQYFQFQSYCFIMSSTIATFWRRLSKAKHFNEGSPIDQTVFRNLPFKNTYNKLGHMYQLRNFHFNNTPYNTTKQNYAVELARLHHQLNFLNGR